MNESDFYLLRQFSLRLSLCTFSVLLLNSNITWIFSNRCLSFVDLAVVYVLFVSNSFCKIFLQYHFQDMIMLFAALSAGTRLG